MSFRLLWLETMVEGARGAPKVEVAGFPGKMRLAQPCQLDWITKFEPQPRNTCTVQAENLDMWMYFLHESVKAILY